ncbi:MAG: DUF72 domain-containing protein [Deltaproteobacteria bacterium]|nr:DUF72 domain-containing protein [Deltaproteobacteria bacterium]
MAQSTRADEGQLALFAQPPPAPAPSKVPPAEHAQELHALGRRLSPRVHLGTSSWSFPGWEGLVWGGRVAKSVLSQEGLGAYSQHPLMRAVGVDRTWYAPVEAAVLADYAAQVPEAFRFLVKASEASVTQRWPSHARYGAHRGEPNPRFLDPAFAIDQVVGPFVEGLGAKAGPLVFQFPPQRFSGLGGNDGFADHLYRFLDALPRGPLYAVEVRNPALLGPRYAEALTSLGVAHCINVWGRMPAPEIQWQQARVAEAPALVIRWMLGFGNTYEAALERYAPFTAIVDADLPSRATLARLIRDATAMGKPTYAIINNKAEGCAPESVRRLAEMIEAEGAA